MMGMGDPAEQEYIKQKLKEDLAAAQQSLEMYGRLIVALAYRAKDDKSEVRFTKKQLEDMTNWGVSIKPMKSGSVKLTVSKTGDV